MAKIQLEIWSDIVCPFCYIGKRRFEQALENFPNIDIAIEWKSFQLDPHVRPQNGKDVYDYLAERYGKDRNWSMQTHQSVAAQAKELGLEYNFDQAKITNTHLAHQLAHIAKDFGKGELVEELLFKAYFTDGKDLNQLETLLQIGEEAGLNADDVRYHLERQSFHTAVEADILEAQQIGVRGVPFFVFNRQYAVSGAQHPDVFIETLSKLLE